MLNSGQNVQVSDTTDDDSSRLVKQNHSEYLYPTPLTE